MSAASLADAVDLVLDSDRRFFERHPHRSHRLRIASAPEIRQVEEVGGGEVMLDMDCRLYVAIRQIRPGVRIRHFIPNRAGLDTDLTEDQIRWIFDRWVPESSLAAKVEKVIREAIADKRGARS